MSDYGLKVSKPGIDVKTAPHKDLIFSSQFDSMKIHQTGSLSISLPAETISANAETRGTGFDHNFGYVPFCLPLVNQMYFTGDLASAGDYLVNDLEEADIPPGTWSFPSAGEVVTVYVSTNSLGFVIDRYEGLGIGQSFGARVVTVYYTLCYNEIGTEFNYL